MDLPLRTISYIADIGNMVVLMARGKMVRSRSAQENLDHAAEQTNMTQDDRRLYRMICHVFESEDVSQCCNELMTYTGSNICRSCEVKMSTMTVKMKKKTFL